MAVGEFISVSSQRDSEQADIEKERVEQSKGAPDESTHIWQTGRYWYSFLRYTALIGVLPGAPH